MAAVGAMCQQGVRSGSRVGLSHCRTVAVPSSTRRPARTVREAVPRAENRCSAARPATGPEARRPEAKEGLPVLRRPQKVRSTYRRRYGPLRDACEALEWWLGGDLEGGKW
jgi:hypothetical protein